MSGRMPVQQSRLQRAHFTSKTCGFLRQKSLRNQRKQLIQLSFSQSNGGKKDVFCHCETVKLALIR
jgi:hypothetical protein